jgi:Uma2 family endonuclease
MISTQVGSHVFTVDDYHRMGEAGIFTEDDRVELIEGEIVDMTPIGNRHIGVVDRINEIFAVLGLSKRAIVGVQSPVRLGDNSEPQPDLLLLRRRDDFYTTGPAGPAEVFLLLEVADSSLAFDRDRKAPLYAQSGIPEYWIVDINAKCIHVYRQPTESGFLSVTVAVGSDPLHPIAFPDVAVVPDEIVA